MSVEASSRRRSFELAAIAALYAAGLIVEHERGGVELLYLAFGSGLVGPVFASIEARRGRAEGPPGWTLALAFGAFTGLVAFPIATWAHALVALSAMAVALRRSGSRGEARATAIEELFVLILAGAAAWVAWRASAPIELLAIAPLAVEAYRPGAARGARTPFAARAVSPSCSGRGSCAATTTSPQEASARSPSSPAPPSSAPAPRSARS
jgi:hypothetical protein